MSLGHTSGSGAPPNRSLTRPDYLAIAGVFLLALLVRLVHVLQSRAIVFFDFPVVDGRAYLDWADRIVRGDWLGRETFYQAPLYPYFLAVTRLLIGPDLFWLRVVQIVLGAVSCVLLLLAGRALFSRRAGVAAGVILALYPPAIFFDALIQKSVLDLLWMALLLWLTADSTRRVSTWCTLAAGAVLGLLCLTRENALILVPVLVVWFAWCGAAMRSSPCVASPVAPGAPTPTGSRAASRWATRASGGGVFLAGLLAILLPVGLRNWAVGGEFVLTTAQAGPNFYIGNHPDAPGLYVPLRPGRGGPRTERADATELAEAAVGHPLTPGEVSGYWLGQAWRFIREQPGAWLRLLGRKMLFTFNAYEVPDAEDLYYYGEYCTLTRGLGWILHFGTLWPLAAAGLVLTGARWRQLWALYASAAAMALSVIAFYVFARYRFPLVPIFALFAGAAVAEAWATLRARFMEPTTASGSRAASSRRADGARRTPLSRNKSRPRPASAAVNAGAAAESRIGVRTFVVAGMVLVLTAVSANRLPPLVSKRSQVAVSHSNAGDALYEHGRYAAGLAEYDVAVRLEPLIMEAHLGRAQCLVRLGRPREADAAYAQARRLAPDAAQIELDYGKSLADSGDWPRAVEHLRRAAVLLPVDPEVQQKLSDALARLNTGAGSQPARTP